MKTKVVFLVSLVLIALAVSCASGNIGAAPIGSATGTAMAAADGFGGEVSVTITMNKGFITDVQIKGDAETAAVGGLAIARAPALIKLHNSPRIDAISGATITSNAIVTAAQAAVDKIVAGN